MNDREVKKMEGMLGSYRVLDLTDEKGLLCGKLMGDLGADVIKIEKSGGDPARSIGPFYHDEVDPEKSLFWWAFNTSKRGITLDIETTDGQQAFKKLVETADFVIESFSPGYMDKLGLGYPVLEKINPGIIVVSITPFGQTGPYKDYKAPDIVAAAMGGQVYSWGDPDRAPVRIGHHYQTYCHTAAQAAVGAMLALYYRGLMGKGQHVDVSVQETVVRTVEITSYWDMMQFVLERGDSLVGRTDIRRTWMWPCKDGYIIWIYWGGFSAYWNLPLVKWMDKEGAADEFLRTFDWDGFDYDTASRETIDHLEDITAEFFRTRTKAELLDGALKNKVMLYPISDIKDIMEDTQLASRNFWVEVEHPELGCKITYPGPFAHASETPPVVRHRAPLIGEHNKEVFEKEAGVFGGGTRSFNKKLPGGKEGEKFETKLLQGVKIADFSRHLVGPITTKTFADYGAQVVKIEGRSRLDSRRYSGAFKDNLPGVNRCGGFNPFNTGKLSVALNLADPKALDIVKKLVAWADVVVENFAGGAMERMGLGYDVLKKIKPDIIMLSSCAMGQTGLYPSSPATGVQLTALSGFSHIAGWPDRAPAQLGVYTDFVAPHFNALTILAALDNRRITGKGQYIDMSQYENSVHFVAPLALDYVVNGRVANRMGNRAADAAPHGIFRCRGEGRWCAIAVFSDEEWRSFCKVFNNPEWAGSSKFATFQARKENEDELDKLIESWTLKYSAEEVMKMMQEVGVGAGVIQNGRDLLENDPHLKYREFFQQPEHPEIGRYFAARAPFVLSRCPCELKSAPLLGEHNEYILKDIIGISDDDIAEMLIEGVVE